MYAATDMATHYDVLLVARDADLPAIRESYKRLALTNHPDKRGPTMTAIMQTINAAYECLSDPVRRLKYDLSLPAERRIEQQQQQQQTSEPDEEVQESGVTPEFFLRRLLRRQMLGNGVHKSALRTRRVLVVRGKRNPFCRRHTSTQKVRVVSEWNERKTIILLPAGS